MNLENGYTKKGKTSDRGGNNTTPRSLPMFKIAHFPKKLNSFFDSMASKFHWEQDLYFRDLVLAIAFSWDRKNISSLYRHLDANHHRTRYNNFLDKARWEPEEMLRQKAMDLLHDMKPQPGETIYLVIDDTKNKKRGKKMEGTGKIFDPSTKTFGHGHQYVTATLCFREITIPFGIRMYVNKKSCRSLKIHFKKTTEMAAELISEFQPPEGLKAVVLFDSFYLNKTVTKACRAKDFCFVSVLANNRNLFKGGRKLKAGVFGKNQLRCQKTKKSIGGKYRYVDAGWLDTNSIGRVHVIFSKMASGKKQGVTLVTDDPKLSAQQILKTYEHRWSIEVFFKDTKQHLGLGQYQNGSLRAAVNHLHLVCFAYSLLTHLSLGKQGAQGKRIKEKKSNRAACKPSTRTLQNHLRKIVWEDLVQHVKRKSPEAMMRELNRLLIAV